MSLSKSTHYSFLTHITSIWDGLCNTGISNKTKTDSLLRSMFLPEFLAHGIVYTKHFSLVLQFVCSTSNNCRDRESLLSSSHVLRAPSFIRWGRKHWCYLTCESLQMLGNSGGSSHAWSHWLLLPLVPRHICSHMHSPPAHSPCFLLPSLPTYSLFCFVLLICLTGSHINTAGLRLTAIFVPPPCSPSAQITGEAQL